MQSVLLLSALHNGIVGAISMLLMFGVYYGWKGLVHFIKKPKKDTSVAQKIDLMRPKEQNDAMPSEDNNQHKASDVSVSNYTYTTTYSLGEPTSKKERVKQKKSIISIIGYIAGVVMLICIGGIVIAINKREKIYEEETESIRLFGKSYIDDSKLFGEQSIRLCTMEDSWGDAMQFRLYDNTEKLRNGILSYASNHNAERIFKVPYLRDRYYSDLLGRRKGISLVQECETIDILEHPSLREKQVYAFKSTEQVRGGIAGVVKRPCYHVLIIDPPNKQYSRIYYLKAIGADHFYADYHIAHMLYDYPLCAMSGYELKKDNKMPDSTCTIIICICSLLFALMTILFFKKR